MTSQASSSEQQTSQASDEGESASGASAFAAALAKTVNDDDPPPGGSGEDDSGKPGESRHKGKPSDLAAVAERLGVQVADLYAVKVPASGGREPLTIGQIKDRFAEFESLEADRLQFSESRIQQERDLEQARAEIRELLSAIPGEHLKKEVLQRVAQRVAERNTAARAKVVEVIPEWRDENLRTTETKELDKLMEGYGFPAGFASGIHDARLLKFMRDAMRREQQVRKALESVRKVTKQPTQATGTRAAPKPAGNQDQRPSMRPTTGRERFSEALRRNT